MLATAIITLERSWDPGGSDAMVNDTPTGAGPLAGVTVIDLSRALAGPYASLMLVRT